MSHGEYGRHLGELIAVRSELSTNRTKKYSLYNTYVRLLMQPTNKKADSSQSSNSNFSNNAAQNPQDPNQVGDDLSKTYGIINQLYSEEYHLLDLMLGDLEDSHKEAWKLRAVRSRTAQGFVDFA